MKATISYALLFVLTFLSLAPAAQAQQQSSAPAQPTVVQPASSQVSLDAMGVRRYVLGPGDTLDVRVFGQPEMNWQGEVDSDGNLSSLPFIDKPIPARCRTDKEVEKDIRAAYSKILKQPDVSVRVTGRNSRLPAYVFGAFQLPQQVQMLRPVRLNEIFARSGGTTERSNGKIQIVHTVPVMCPEPGQEAEGESEASNFQVTFKVYSVADLKAGKEEANPYIRPGDIIHALEAEPVYINGNVASPQPIYLSDGLTLSTALAMVGGVRKDTKQSGIVIYRINPKSQYRERLVFDLQAIKKNKLEDPQLQPYDIIEVPEAGPSIIKTILNSALGMAPGPLSGFASQLPYRVLY
ncbi:MAG TPA: polysaccharide biosynthesis/export family protein [Pyrinomonadaceae bacterium]|nr:polysaccharide biosynthesis/export family protein [Pyrinomonadaceae bacterium]